MEQQQRGRSPSAGHTTQTLNHSRSPSAQAGLNNQASAHGVNPTLLQSGSFEQNFPVNQQPFPDSDFLSPDLSHQYSHRSNSSQHSFEQFVTAPNTQFQDPFNPTATNQQDAFSAGVNPQFLDANNENSDQQFQEFLAQNTQFEPQQNNTTDHNGFSLFKNMNDNFNNQYSSPGHSYNNSLSQSFDQPAFQQGSTQGTRSRGQSLSPSSAAVPPGQRTQEWGNMAFQGHRSRPSADAFSDVSSHHSHFVDAMESFDGISGTSPNLQAQGDTSLVNDSLGVLNQISLSEPNVAPSQHTSPGHSNHVSPHMSPQQGFGFDGNDSFGMLAQDPGPQMFETAGPGMEEFPRNVQFNTGEGVAAQTAPEINIQFAGPERQPTMNEPGQGQDLGRECLIPPSRSKRVPIGYRVSTVLTISERSQPSTWSCNLRSVFIT